MRVVLILLLTLLPHIGIANTKITAEKDTQLKIWTFEENGLKLTLTQRSPEFIKAFFLARGFPDQIADEISNSCMLQTVAKNTLLEGDPITISLMDWKVKTPTAIQSIKHKETWDKEWQDTEVSLAARVAYRWATFPTEQNYAPSGDYNWGLTSFDLKPGSKFDLQIFWKHGEEEKSAWIRSMACPKNEN